MDDVWRHCEAGYIERCTSGFEGGLGKSAHQVARTFTYSTLPDGDINVHHTYMRTGVCDLGTYTVDIEQVLRTGVFTASGKPVDYSREVEEALSPLRSATLSLLSEMLLANQALTLNPAP